MAQGAAGATSQGAFGVGALADVDAVEGILWTGTPALRYCAWQFAACLLLAFLVFPLLYAGWLAVKLKHVRYTVTTERIRVQTGIFTRRWDDLELHRVKDLVVLQSFWRERLLGLARLEVLSADGTTPVLVLFGVRHGDLMQLCEQVRRHAARVRLARGTMVMESI